MSSNNLLSQASLNMRRVIHTFDIFDTLIARRCIHAKEVFEEVGRRSGISGFTQHRLQAEQSVAAGEYVFADIYRALADQLGLDDESAETLMNLEVLVELENVVPVQTMLNKLTAESVLITDMYLPEPVIRELLKQCGVHRDLPILISAHGKSSGRLWAEFADMGIQCLHHGDNHSSDVTKARAAGMRTRHVSWSFLTDFETFLYERGAKQAAQALRVARLKVDINELPAWLQSLQFNVNVPFLLISSLDLLSQVRELGVQKVLFASRDGRHLQAAFEALRDQFEDLTTVASSYWYTSRVARTQSSDAYLSYCREVMEGAVAIVDLCGTGASLTKLLARLSDTVAAPFLYLAQSVVDIHYRARMAKGYGLGAADQLTPVHSTFSTGSFINNSLMEQLNYVPEGMTRGVADTMAGFLPLRDELDFEGEALELIKAQALVLNEYFVALRNELTPEALTEFIEVVPAAHEWLLLTVGDRANELRVLEAKIGIDDMSNENLTVKNLGV